MRVRVLLAACVALAAIQGLHQLIVEKDAMIDSQQRQIGELVARMACIEARLAPATDR